MTKNSNISIIVPIHNVESYLARCLDSLINQTLKDIEIICVDDGSTDGSLEILKEYADKDSRIVVLQQESHGVEWARAEAMELVSSDYIMFCDSDDWYEPKMCEKMYEKISKNDADIVMCDVNIVGEKDKGMKKYFAFMPKQGKYEQPFDFFDKTAMVLWKCIFKKKLIDKYKIVFPQDSRIKRGYDTYFCIQYLMGAKTIYFLHKKLYNYWQRSDSLVHQFNMGNSETALSPIYGFGYVLDFMHRNNFYDTYKQKLLPWIDKKYHLLLCSKINLREEGSEALKCIYEMFKPFENDITPKYDLLYKVLYQEHKILLKDLLQKYNASYAYKLGPITLLKIKKKFNRTKIYLFGLLPIFKTKEELKQTRIYLFGFIPLLRIKEKK